MSRWSARRSSGGSRGPAPGSGGAGRGAVARGAGAAAQRIDGRVVGTASLGGQPVPVPRFGALPPEADFEGDLEAMCFLAGEGVGLVTPITAAGGGAGARERGA